MTYRSKRWREGFESGDPRGDGGEDEGIENDREQREIKYFFIYRIAIGYFTLYFLFNNNVKGPISSKPPLSISPVLSCRATPSP